MSRITASCTFHDTQLTDLPVLNPGNWFGKAWLIEISGSYTSFYCVVEADSVSDAIDEFSDDETYGHQIHVADEDLGDYPEADRHYDGNGRVLDLDWLNVHGTESSSNDHLPVPSMRYRVDGMPANGIDPRRLDDWPYDRNGATFGVIEYTSGFAVRHNPSGEEHWMSDGVDVLTDDDDNPISPGTDGFCEQWADALNANESETLEAYFPQFVPSESA